MIQDEKAFNKKSCQEKIAECITEDMIKPHKKDKDLYKHLILRYRNNTLTDTSIKDDSTIFDAGLIHVQIGSNYKKGYKI